MDNDPFALDAMCAMISAVSKDFHVMWGTGSPAVAIEHCHNRIPGRTCRCRILRNLLVSLQLIAIPTEEMIGENDTHYLFIRLQLVFEHKFHLAVIHQPCV